MSARRAGGLLLGRAVCVRTGLAPSAAHHRHLRADVRASGRPAAAGGGADPAYPNQGGTSEILRFIRNSTKDGFLSDPILKGNKHLLSSGWGNNHAIEGVNGIERFYNQVLPTKYMQHFEIMSRTDDEVKFTDNLVGVREGANINYYKNCLNR